MADITVLASTEEVSERIRKLIDERFGGKVEAFAQECMKIDKSVNGGLLSSYLNRGSMPGLKKAAVIAAAAGVSLDWLAGISKPAPEERERADDAIREMGQRLIDPDRVPPVETAKMLTGYFDFGDRVIKASLLMEAYGPPSRFGRYRPEEPGVDE